MARASRPYGNSTLSGVASVPRSSRAWANGQYITASGGGLGFLLSWNGTGWKTVPSPNPGRYDTGLFAVAAVSAADAWAVGDYESILGSNRTLILHWNGTRWKQVPSPLLVVGKTTAWAAWLPHPAGTRGQWAAAPGR